MTDITDLTYDNIVAYLNTFLDSPDISLNQDGLTSSILESDTIHFVLHPNETMCEIHISGQQPIFRDYFNTALHLLNLGYIMSGTNQSRLDYFNDHYHILGVNAIQILEVYNARYENT